MPSVGFSLNFDAIHTFFEELKSIAEPVQAGLVATGPAAAYADVWEWGNLRQTKQGPRTVQGTNPKGETVWLSSQAPMGYIGIHSDEFVQIVQDHIQNMDILHPSMTASEALKKAARDAMHDMKELVQLTAPVDSSQLRDCFEVVGDGDPALQEYQSDLGSRFGRVLTIA